MCCRFTINKTVEEMEDRFQAKFINGSLFATSREAAPGAPISIVMKDEDANSIEQMRWGLIAPWSQTPIFNTRGDKLSTSPFYQTSYEQRRCLIPAESFLEWRKTPAGKPHPHSFSLKSSSLFAFAGIWQECIQPDGATVKCASVITTEPNSLLAAFHPRMPVILRRSDEADWLRQPIGCNLSRLLVPYPASDMQVGNAQLCRKF